MTARYNQGAIPQPGESGERESELRRLCEALPVQVFNLLDEYAINQALAQIMDALTAANQYLEQTAPWKRAKEGDEAGVNTSLYTASEALRIASVLMSPVMPAKMQEVWERLGWRPPDNLASALSWGLLVPGEPVATGEPLFPRLLEEEA
jgi:methionyl-tRNA synthetase